MTALQGLRPSGSLRRSCDLQSSSESSVPVSSCHQAQDLAEQFRLEANLQAKTAQIDVLPTVNEECPGSATGRLGVPAAPVSVVP